jgi:signal transduction histidine kinase
MRPLLFFYALVVYILLQFCWWSYLLVRLNDEIYEQKLQLLELKNVSGQSLEKEEHVLLSNLHKRWMMIAGEGIVFGLLLIAGIHLTHRSFKKEFTLARQQRNFLLAVTHEFKSPLAAIKLSLQTLDKHQLDKEQQHKILTRAIHETNRIDALVENALAAARYEDRSFHLNKELFNFSNLVHELVEMRKNLNQRHLKYNSFIQPEIYLNGDKLALQSAVLNMLDNAEKYSPEAGTINLELKEREKHVVISVKDQGPGIPPDERKKVFEKFYRIGNEETRAAKGTGLGLYIVSNVAQLHGGKVFIKDNQPQGTVIEMILKK